MDAHLARYPVSVEIPVAWGEMDAFQHINNVVYLRWLETARMAYFVRLGVMERMERERVGPILARNVVDYRLPVTWPDTVRVDITVTRIGGSSYTMAYRVTSNAQGVVVATGESVLVNYDYTAGRPASVDDALRSAIAAVEASAPGA